MILKASHWSQGLFLIGFGVLVGMFSTSSCHRDDDDAVAAVESSARTKIHVSTTVAGPINVAANASDFVVRSINFTPTNTNDVLLYVVATGSYTHVVASLQFKLEIQDAGGQRIVNELYKTGPLGAGLPFRLVASLPNFHFASGGFTQDSMNTSSTFPSASYTIRLLATNSDGVNSADVADMQFKIVTLENVTVSNPSSNIS